MTNQVEPVQITKADFMSSVGFKEEYQKALAGRKFVNVLTEALSSQWRLSLSSGYKVDQIVQIIINLKGYQQEQLICDFSDKAELLLACYL